MAGRSSRSDADLVRAVVGDDPTAFGELFERWFDRVYDVARNIVRNDDTAAEVAQDVFLTSWQRLDQLDDPERFGGWLLRTSRNRALNRLEKERRAQPLEGDRMTGLHDAGHGGDAGRDDLVGSNRILETEAISDARHHQQLVWAAAAALGERDASLLDLHLRHQLSPAEIADELGVSANNAHQLLFRLRSKLGDAVANHQVWRDGSPRCDELAALIDGDPFDASVSKIVQRHASRCSVCGTERQRVVDPTKLFAAVPIAIAPALLRDQAAAALAAQNVPVTSSAGTAGSLSGSGADSTHDDRTSTRRRPRRIAFLAVVMVVLIAAVLVLAKPSGEADLALDGSDDGPAADTATTQRDLAPPSTDSATTIAPPTPAPTTAPTPTPAPTTTPTTARPRSTTTTIATTTTATASTTASTSAPPPPTDPPQPPTIVRFSLGTPTDPIFCQDSTDLARRAVWLVEDTTGVDLTTANGTTARDPSGSHTFCAPAGSTVTLTATGPGGSVSDSRTVS